jgi:glycosyltransferase involved in cell wall biosynthesis
MARSSGEYLLWLGGIFDHATMLRRPAVVPSARRTQRDLVQALESKGVTVRTLGHVPEPLWPKGRLRDRGVEPLEPGITGDTVAYWNLPGLRQRSLIRQYLAGYVAIRRRYGPPGLVLSYNAYPHNIAVGKRAQADGVPWVPIVADVRREEEARHHRATNQAAGRVFLSWAEYSDPSNREPKLHLDHGVDALGPVEQDRGLESPPVVLYTGSLSRFAGVSFLVEAFRRVERTDIELWICGFGSNADVDRAAAEDDRVRFLGLVSEEELHEVSQRATLFVNPRPSSIPENNANFPSKLLDYLKYGKPIISTWTGGIAPDYRRVLTVLEEETPECLARTIEEVVAWEPERRMDLARRIRRFVETEKLWSVHAERLLAWLADEVGARFGRPG